MKKARSGVGDGDRTRDPLLGWQMLYRLSYTDVDPGGMKAQPPAFLTPSVPLVMRLAQGFGTSEVPGLPVFPGRQSNRKRRILCRVSPVEPETGLEPATP